LTDGRGITGKWYRHRVTRNILKTCAVLSAAAVACEGLYRLGVSEQNIRVVMVLAVFIIAVSTDGYAYGLFAVPAGVFIYDVLVAEPRFSLEFTPGFFIMLGIMLMVALVTSPIIARIKRQRETAREQERRAERLYEINRRLLSTRDVDSIARYAMGYLEEELRRSVALRIGAGGASWDGAYFRQSEGDVPEAYFQAPGPVEAMRLAARRREPAGEGTDNEPDAGAYCHPVMIQAVVYGVFAVSCAAGVIAEEGRAFIALICEQTAQALRMQALTAQQQRARVMAETEKARNSFLRGISHDLRTPLTSIIGSSATFLESRDELPADTQLQLVKGINEDAQWLLSMVENILSVTRIQQRGMAVEKTEEAAEEVVAQAVAVFRKRFPEASITIRQTRDILFVPMDALLISQVITNLLDNSQRHAKGRPSAVTIAMRQSGGYAQFTITDTGPGIDEDILPDLFEIRQARRGHNEDASRGLGIGLSICKSIIQAHGGWIRAWNVPDSGAEVCFGLPLYKEADDGQ
jgi:two-component system sensor histidine kinase KdpD